MATVINLDSLQQEWSHIKDMVRETDTVCTELSKLSNNIASQNNQGLLNFTLMQNINCGAIQLQMRTLLSEIQEYNVEHFQDSKIRSRRGFLNIVGE